MAFEQALSLNRVRIGRTGVGLALFWARLIGCRSLLRIVLTLRQPPLEALDYRERESRLKTSQTYALWILGLLGAQARPVARNP